MALGLILGIETSCDETSAAVIDSDGVVLSNVVASQADLHARFGGVVPEVASRRHLQLTTPVIETALEQAGVGLDHISAVAVTEGPGLIGALLVGLATAKAIAFARRLPLIPVNHLHGHVASLYLAPDPMEPPFLCLLASGGHTILADVGSPGRFDPIGASLDDAAGEAFDKGARLLGLGYPGGAELERLAAGGDAGAYSFPTAMLGRPGYDFSFSGLKTALRHALAEHPDPADRPHLAASYQAAIVRSLVTRAVQALDATGHTQVALVGGVAANSVLRAALTAAGAKHGAEVRAAPLDAVLGQRRHDCFGGAVQPGRGIPRLPHSRRLCGGVMTVEVVIYSGAGCHLCDVAKAQLEAQRQRLELDIRVIEIDGDPALETAYREQIPVVFVAGCKAFKFRVDLADLERRVRRAERTV